jgi:hypothetical protein
MLVHQCYNGRGYGPEEAYCKIHDPAKVEARRKASSERGEREFQDMRITLAAPAFFAALCKIADGANDPRQVAADAIKNHRSAGNG